MPKQDIDAYHPSGGQVSGVPQHAIQELVAGQLYEGQCGLALPHQNLVEVRLRGHDRVLPCIWIAGFFSGLLGVNHTFTPLEGTRVLVYYTGRDSSFIVGAWPDTRTTLADRSAVGGPKMADSSLYSAAQARVSDLRGLREHEPPVDVLPGELDLTNIHNVGVTLLRHFASLQAGDLARIEVHLLDDLVRIISQNYKHHTAIGDHQITNDHGRLNAVWHAGAREHETWGSLRPNDPKAQTQGETEVDPPTAKPEDDGRWRYSQYLGWLGDFVHIFVTDPVAKLGRLAQDAVRQGRFHCHVNNDGSLLVQSVADIVFEKVIAIPTPIQLRREDDPTGDKVPDQDTFAPSPLANNWQPSDAGSVFEMAFQLREYSRWLNTQLSLARFRQMPKDWKVPTQAETLEQADALASEQVAPYYLAYACIRIYRDGSIQNVDAYGNAITMSANGTQVSSTRDLLLQAAGSVNIVAGRDVNVRARRHVTQSCDEGNFTVKGRGIQLMASTDNILLETIPSRTVHLVSSFRIGDGLSIHHDGTLRCVSPVFINRLTASGSIYAGYLSHGTVLIDGKKPHAGHVGVGGGGSAVTLDEVPGTVKTFKFPDGPSSQTATTYGPAVWYQTVSQSQIAKQDSLGNASGFGQWNLAADDANRGLPWPGLMAYKFTTAGEKVSAASSSNTAPNTPAAMASLNPAQVAINMHYRL